MSRNSLSQIQPLRVLAQSVVEQKPYPLAAQPAFTDIDAIKTVNALDQHSNPMKINYDEEEGAYQQNISPLKIDPKAQKSSSAMGQAEKADQFIDMSSNKLYQADPLGEELEGDNV